MAAHRSRGIAAAIVRGSFNPIDQFPGEAGAELEALVGAFCTEDESDWVLERSHRFASVLDGITALIANFEKRRVTPPLERVEEAGTYFRFSVAIRADDDVTTQKLRKRFRLHSEMVTALQNLDPSDFETLCGLILTKIGCTSNFVTRSSQDYGADFLGRAPMSPAGAPTALSRVLGALSFVCFGQAKRHAEDNVVSDGPLKELAASWDDVVDGRIDESLHPHLEEGLRAIGWRAADAVFLVFACTSSYTRRAMSYAERKGMAILDGDQLAQLLLEIELGVEEDPGTGSWSTGVEIVAGACR